MFYRLYDKHRTLSPYDLYSLLIGALPDDRIHQASALFGLAVAFPYFDRKVQSFVRRIPFADKYDRGVSKVLYRQLLEEHLPSYLWDIPKHGFDYAIDRLMRHDNCALLSRYLSQEAITAHGLFSFPVVQRQLTYFLSGDSRSQFRLWALLLFQAWYHNHYLALE